MGQVRLETVVAPDGAGERLENRDLDLALATAPQTQQVLVSRLIRSLIPDARGMEVRVAQVTDSSRTWSVR
ncbi:MAG: hypothetical protein M3069_07765 [Chloroflexota bacterium]|nr:hypothetical protein [Chloroflexota bacterium]